MIYMFVHMDHFLYTYPFTDSEMKSLNPQEAAKYSWKNMRL